MALVNVSALQSLVGLRVNIFPHLYAEVVAPGSSAYEEARRLQLERFASTVTSGPYAGDPYLQGQAYLQVTEYAPERTVPIVIRTTDYALDNEDWYPPDTLVGAARLELSGATFIEATMRLQPHALARRALDGGHVAEIGGFTTPKDLKKSLLIDVLDTLAAAIVHVSAGLEIEWLWLQPRVGFMSLVCATIPDLLPPYRFAYSLDVAGWNEESEQLKRYRLLGQKGEENFPEIYQIHQATLEKDLEERVRLWTSRYEHRHEMEDLLFRAMRRAHRHLMRDPARVSAKARFAVRPQLPEAASEGTASPLTRSASATYAPQEQAVDTPVRPEQSQATKFAFTGSTSADVTYLRALRRDGGSAIQGYKDLSYDLLELEPGMTILDVGCGDGTDLQNLSARVGPQGHAIGVERNQELAAYANKLLDAGGYQNATVFRGEAEHLTFPNQLFDRVRADRAVQHFQRPIAGLAEMWRVLRPGGILTIIEPDWGAIALDPGSAQGGNDDATFMYVMKWVRHHLPHALIGRRLSGLLRRVGNWSKVEVFAHSLCSTDWPVIDAALELSKSAGLAAAAAPERKPEIDAWLEQVNAAAATGTFFAAVPLFFACARK
ncbi:MAG: methyltransferase domain-containing protein [Ktedonobacterales bacterium]